jgi:prepilin-type N-terminal cleavage/methylation domain
MKKGKGFTLIELLAVIVILAIILAIAIPGISDLLENARRNAFASDAKMVIKTVEHKILQDNSFNPSTVEETNIDSLLDISNINYQILTVKMMDEKVYVTIVGKNKWSNLTASGTRKNIQVTDTVTTLVRGANAPQLVTGMTPIIWNGTTWVNTTESDTAGTTTIQATGYGLMPEQLMAQCGCGYQDTFIR